MDMDSKKVGKDSVDFLIKQGYKKLSAKTFISDVDLEQFLNKDFAKVSKTRALGFIQILEREYDVDLSDLREEYLTFESAHQPKKVDSLFTEVPMDDGPDWQKYLPYLAGFFLLSGIVYYLLRPTSEATQTQQTTKQTLEENKSVISQAEKNIETLDNNSKKEVSKNNLKGVLETSLNKEKNISKEENDDLDLDKVVLEMMKERNLSIGSSVLDKSLNETNTTDKQDKPLTVSKVQEKNETKVPSVVKAPKVPTKHTKKRNLDTLPLAKTMPITKQKTTTKTKKDTKSVTKGLYIKPIQKTWVGVIYLDDFTKKDFLIRKKLPLDASRDQLIVVGHSQFKIYNNTYSVKFRAKGPVRFIYKDGELMEVNKKEFLRTSEGVTW